MVNLTIVCLCLCLCKLCKCAEGSCTPYTYPIASIWEKRVFHNKNWAPKCAYSKFSKHEKILNAQSERFLRFSNSEKKWDTYISPTGKKKWNCIFLNRLLPLTFIFISLHTYYVSNYIINVKQRENFVKQV